MVKCEFSSMENDVILIFLYFNISIYCFSSSLNALLLSLHVARGTTVSNLEQAENGGEPLCLLNACPSRESAVFIVKPER